jgi:hypothetical protein
MIVADKSNALQGVKVFGMLTVLGEPFGVRRSGRRRTFVVCECQCGRIVAMDVSNIVHSANGSCGCNKPGMAPRHGQRQTPLYWCWSMMVQRCTNPNCHAWPRYGGRGITLCTEWRTFENFYEWAMQSGYRDLPDKPRAERLSIDRINNDLGYNPDNCRWIPFGQNCSKQDKAVLLAR